MRIMNVKTVEEMESALISLREGCEDVIRYIDTDLEVIRMDDADQDVIGYWRMIEIIEAKIQDMAR